MTKKRRNFFVNISGLLLIIFLFLLISYLIQTNLISFEKYILNNYIGMLIYILITIFATVFAPVSAIPLMPIASNIFGWVTTAIISIIGWTIGSIIAFILSRKYGTKLVSKIVSLKSISKYENMIPKKHIFLSIILIRIVLPVDILSYTLGIFSKINLMTYSLATLIGVTPFAFILAYLGIMPIKYQIISGLILGIFLLYIMYEISKRKNIKI